ncbi:ribosomal protein S6 kinase-like 1 isoform X1 [Drosophila kikkawai]|uniref:Ribosomal protein S6 kinase-like 1 isoform X1 n=1 Tax=Drosophila kikkawai TaxID=30033 RepID=A0A6P4JHS0_DROKI|nr:ribosomal protein S6 kinase delta-1 isoform X1 [Drosophila kikkawai]
MSLNLGGWIHSFTVADAQEHKGGYTIYKITSIVFPRSVPQALTCLVVWKRFHDVKRLHRELSRRHKSLQLPGKLPVPTDSSYFKRFDAVVIQRRKEYILTLLDFAALHPALYKCAIFTQFFQETPSPNGSPLKKLYVERSLRLETAGADSSCSGGLGSSVDSRSRGGAIADICDKLDLPYDPHDAGGITPLDPRCDKEQPSPADYGEPDEKETKTDAESKLVEEASTKRDYLRLLTPMASIESEDSDYIYEAALEFSHAVQAEVNLNYVEAYERYKHGVDLLLKGAKQDANEERRFIAKAKIAKYLARAEEIHANFLGSNCPIKKLEFQLSLDMTDGENVTQLECPWNQLARYKVLHILEERVMQVQCVTKPQQPATIMKGIEKPASNSLTQSIFLPQEVPYMVKLLAYFQSDQKIFLLLRQAEGGRLYDYLQSYTPTSSKCVDYAELFPAEQEERQEPLTAESDVSDLVRSSQQLLKSVSNTLSNLQAGLVTHRKRGAYLDGVARNKPIPEQCLRQWACELAIAIHSLHGKGVILRDLHMANILLGDKGQLLLTYFYQNEGISSDDNYVHKALSLEALANHFVAPERPLTFRSDWWSYGVVLYQLLLGVPYKTTHPGQLELYGCVQYPTEPLEISDHATDLLEQLLQLTPELRLDYEQIREHPFFKGINWQQNECRITYIN